MYKLARIYYDGEGVEKNFEKAFELYERAANAGYEDAINAIVFIGAENFVKIADKYFDGKNFVQAAKFY